MSDEKTASMLYKHFTVEPDPMASDWSRTVWVIRERFVGLCRGWLTNLEPEGEFTFSSNDSVHWRAEDLRDIADALAKINKTR